MSTPPPEIRSVPVDLITILNPRVRNKRIFQELVNSIAHLGLKKPITISQRPGKTRFDLVCGQGRLEAFIALGQTEIPAIVIDAAEEAWSRTLRGASTAHWNWFTPSAR